MEKRRYIWLITILLWMSMTTIILASGTGQALRIGIREGRSSVAVIGTRDVGIYQGNALRKKVKANTPIQVTIRGNELTADGVKSMSPLSVRPLAKDGFVKITDGYMYRGYLEFIKTPASAGMTVINVVPIEQYLYGVVGKEMSPSWSLEALKAQAVAARTYAVSHKNYFKSRGYDMADDTRNQVYGGMNAETPSIQQAVDGTSGEILTYKGKPIEAFFCASAGGWTENSENVWGNAVGYLRGVSDRSFHMPSYSWSVTTTPERLEANLNAAGKGVGTVQSIMLSPLTKRPMRTADRGVSGRVRTMIIRGTKGQATVTGNAFQSLFGLKSTLFDFYQGKGTPPNPDLGHSSRSMTLPIKAGQPLTIYGFGWGHGLGMSQYGAYQMAKENPGVREYYRQILLHYYTGTTLERLY